MGTKRGELREMLGKGPRAGSPGKVQSSDPSPFSRGVSDDEAQPTAEQIAIAAYYRAQARGFEPGHEMEDWLEAESELASRGTRPS